MLLLLLLGCGTPSPDITPACAHDVDGWYGGLSRHLRYREDGGFDYEAEEPWVEGYQGRWDPHGDSFGVLTRYAQGYFLTRDEQVGVGWLEPDGDYGLRWTQWTLDRLGVQQRHSVEERREGCFVERVVQGEGDRVDAQLEILDADTVAGTVLSTASDFDVSGTWRSDHSAELSYAGHDGESWYEVSEPGDGTRRAGFHLRYSGGVEDGGYVRGFEGDREYRFDRTPDEGDWVVLHIWWLLRYDGSGEGEVVGEGTDGGTLTCWYEWDSAGVGSYTCDDGTSGPY